MPRAKKDASKEVAKATKQPPAKKDAGKVKKGRAQESSR